MKSCTSLSLLPLALAGNILAQTLPDGKRLKDNGLLVGATAEVGSSDKEGLFSWKDAAKVETVMQREFGLVQTTAYPVWDTWNGSGINSVSFDLTKTNKVIDKAKSMGSKVAVHLLAGSPTYFPSWLNSGNFSPAQLDTLLNHWITYATTTNGNAQKVDYWNVVNEALMWNGQYWDSSSTANTNPWQRMGWEDDKSGLTGSSMVFDQHPAYIRRAFELARKHTSAKLELRDYGIEFWRASVKARAFYQLVRHLLNTGVPLDAVGLQGHFRTDASNDWSKLQQTVQEYRKLGLEVYLTEVDIGDGDVNASATTAHRTAAFDSLQAEQYYQMAKAFAAGGGNWICLWGVADNTNTYWRMGQSALLFDESYAAKKSYYRFRQGIVDGLASTAIASRPSESPTLSASIRAGRLSVQGMEDGMVSISDLQGRTVGSVQLRAGEAGAPFLSAGTYLLHSVSDASLRCLVQVLP